MNLHIKFRIRHYVLLQKTGAEQITKSISGMNCAVNVKNKKGMQICAYVLLYLQAEQVFREQERSPKEKKCHSYSNY